MDSETLSELFWVKGKCVFRLYLARIYCNDGAVEYCLGPPYFPVYKSCLWASLANSWTRDRPVAVPLNTADDRNTESIHLFFTCILNNERLRPRSHCFRQGVVQCQRVCPPELLLEQYINFRGTLKMPQNVTPSWYETFPNATSSGLWWDKQQASH